MFLHITTLKGVSPNKIIHFQKWILIGGVLLLVIKFGAYWITNSNAVLSDALESIVNVSAAAFALFSLAYSARPKDLNHPYGHGKIEFLSSGIEGFLVVIAGLSISIKGGYNIFFPQEISNIDLGVYITGFAGLANYLMGMAMIRRGKKENSLLLEAGGKHLQTDAYSTIALIVGLMAIYLFNWLWLDSVIALMFGLYIIYEGYRIVRKSLAGIMDEADFDLLEEVVELLEAKRKPSWIDVHNLRVIKYGTKLHVDTHMTIPWYIDVRAAHDVMTEIEEVIREHFGERIELFVHMDPCTASSCSLCSVANCEKREKKFVRKIEWDLDLLLKNQKHRLKEEEEY